MDFLDAKGLNEGLDILSDFQKWRIKNCDSKIQVGFEMRESWLGELPFYIFWCEDCGYFSYDYPHGHLDRRYLRCYRCKLRIDFRPWWIEWKKLALILRDAWAHKGKR